MTESLVVIISSDKDFAGAVSEQVQKELKVACKTAQTLEEAKAYAPSVAVASGEVKLTCPVIRPGLAPFRMHALLSEIEAALQKPADDGLILSREYVLQIRQKQLMHGPSGKTASLTDKEVQLLQSLASGGAAGLSKEELLRQVWGFEAALDTHTLETHIYRLRSKFRELAGDDTMILAVEGGYALVASVK